MWKRFFERDFKESSKSAKRRKFWRKNTIWQNQYIQYHLKAHASAKWVEHIQQKIPRGILHLLAVPFVIAIVVILVAHVKWDPVPLQGVKSWFTTRINNNDWIPRFTDLGELVAFVVMAMLIWLLVCVVIPFLDFFLEALVEPAFMAVGNKTFGKTLEKWGIDLSNHRTTSVLLAATLFAIILLCIVAFFILYDAVKAVGQISVIPSYTKSAKSKLEESKLFTQ